MAIANNLVNDAHTLVLLDIQAHNDRYMTVNQGLEYLMKVKDDLISNGKYNEAIIDEDTLAIGIARVGSKDVVVRADKLVN